MWAQNGIKLERQSLSTLRKCKCLNIVYLYFNNNKQIHCFYFATLMTFPNYKNDVFIVKCHHVYFLRLNIFISYHFMSLNDSLDGLILRFEAPDSRNRWDSPLFTIQKEDSLPFEAICDALFKRKAPPPNQSTKSVRTLLILWLCSCIMYFWNEYQNFKFLVLFLFVIQQPLSSTNFLYELDKVTQDVLMVQFSFYANTSFRCFVRKVECRFITT